MKIENIGLSFLGLFFLFVSIKNFIFYLKGGATNYDWHRPISPQSWTMKSRGTHGEEILLLQQAVILFLFGLALCFVGFSSVFAG